MKRKKLGVYRKLITFLMFAAPIFILVSGLMIKSYLENNKAELEDSIENSENVKDAYKHIISGYEEKPKNAVQEITQKNAEKTEEELKFERINDKIASMSLEEKVGQMIFVAYRKNLYTNPVNFNEDMASILKKIKPGGVILFSENIKSAEQTKKFIIDIREKSEIPIFVGIDEEGGRVVRTSSLGLPNIPTAQKIGEVGKEKAYDYGFEIGTYLKDLGVDIDFAPVMDINSNPLNTVIGNRAFGKTAEIVSDMSLGFASGLLDADIMPVAKHFPGHGDTKEDSHSSLAKSYKTLDELKELEFIPFEKAIEENIFGVMVGHISLPNVNEDSTPATFSKYIVTDVLRGEMGFKGIIFTDALDMGAVTNYYKPEEIGVLAVQAGIDVLLMPADVEATLDGIIKAVKNGEIEEKRIDESVQRILWGKFDLYEEAF